MRVAISGLGRIGRAVMKNVLDQSTLELVAVNDVGSLRLQVWPLLLADDVLSGDLHGP